MGQRPSGGGGGADAMPLTALYPQLVEAGASTVRALEHEPREAAGEEFRTPLLGVGIALLSELVDQADDYFLFEEIGKLEDEAPEWTPGVPEEVVNEAVPSLPKDFPPPGVLNLFLVHVALLFALLEHWERFKQRVSIMSRKANSKYTGKIGFSYGTRLYYEMNINNLNICHTC